MSDSSSTNEFDVDDLCTNFEAEWTPDFPLGQLIRDQVAAVEEPLRSKMIVELVVSVVVGGFIGYGLDWAFGTLPLFLLLFGGLGFAAGIKTILATARGFVDEDGMA